MQTINFCFGSTALSFCFKFGRILGLFSLFEPFGVFFLSVGAIFGVEVRLENIFGTYKCRLSIFVLEVQPYLFVFHSAKFWAFFALFGLLGAIFGVGVRFKNFFGTCLHRLTTFILEVQLYLASLKLSRVAGWLGGWVAGWLENLILMKTQSSAQTWTWTLDFDLGFVNLWSPKI